MSSLRAGGARPAILDPYPGFERSLLPSLSNLSTLHSYQLALVPFHPEATPSQIAQAKLLFQQRRLAAVARREQLGLPEKQAELRQLERAKDWLEGKVPGSKKMKDAGSQTEERLFTLAEVKERVSNVSRLAVERALSEQRDKFATEISRAVDMAVEEERQNIDERLRQAKEAGKEEYVEESRRRREEFMEQARARIAAKAAAVAAEAPPPPPPAPSPPPAAPVPATSHLPSPPVDDSPDGPFFDFKSNNPRPIPRDLFKLLHIVLCTNLSSDVSPELFYHYLRRTGKHTYPRPLALKRSNSGSIMLAFRSAEHAQLAVSALDGQTLPLAKCRIRSFTRTDTTGNEFRWRDLSRETQDAWSQNKQLPSPLWVGKVPGPGKGISVSEGYHQEWKNVLERRRQKDAQRVREKEAARYSGGGGGGGYGGGGYDDGYGYDDGGDGYGDADGGSYYSGTEQGEYSDEDDDEGDDYHGGYDGGRPSYAPGYYASHIPQTSFRPPALSYAAPPPPPHSFAGPSYAPSPSAIPSFPSYSAAPPRPRTVPPPPPPPPPPPSSSAYQSGYGAPHLPFSLPPSSSSYASAPTAYDHSLARAWDQQDEPTLDPRKRARFG